MKHFTDIICNFLLLFVLLPFNSSSQEKLDLFIWAGQSNAQGWMGDAADYPEEGKELDESILLNWTFVDNESSGGKWIKMQPQTGRFPNGHFIQEQNDVSAQQPEIVQKIEAIFTQEHTPAEIDRFKIKQLGD